MSSHRADQAGKDVVVEARGVMIVREHMQHEKSTRGVRVAGDDRLDAGTISAGRHIYGSANDIGFPGGYNEL